MAIAHRNYWVLAIAAIFSGFTFLVVNLTNRTTLSGASPPDSILENSTEEQFLALHTSGIQKALQGDYPSAILDYNRAILLSTSNSEIYYNRAVAHYSIGDSNLALHDLDRAIQLHPTMAEAFANRSIIRSELGDVKGAVADAQQAADLFARQGNSALAENMQILVKQHEATPNR